MLRSSAAYVSCLELQALVRFSHAVLPSCAHIHPSLPSHLSNSQLHTTSSSSCTQPPSHLPVPPSHHPHHSLLLVHLLIGSHAIQTPPPSWSITRGLSSANRPGSSPRSPPPRSRGGSPSKPPLPRIRVNHHIEAKAVRVVFPDGNNEVLDLPAALSAARKLGLDLVEVAPNAQPPVAKILNFAEYLQQVKQQEAERQKKVQEAAQVEAHTKSKEMRFTVKISDHDLETKLRKVEKFLQDGYRTLLVVQFSSQKEEPAATQALDYIVARLKSSAPVPVEVGPRQPVRKAVAVAVKPAAAPV